MKGKESRPMFTGREKDEKPHVPKEGRLFRRERIDLEAVLRGSDRKEWWQPKE